MTFSREDLILDEASRARLDRFQSLATQTGAVGLALCLGLGLFWPDRFFAAYLVAFLFWIGIALGCVGLTMLHHLVGGQWGLPIRRPMEAGALTLVPLALLFLPVLLNLGQLYPWARSAGLRLEGGPDHKSLYLNVSFFVIRAAVYFALWIGLALLLNHWSRAQDHDPDPSPSDRLQLMSGPGLALLFLSSTFAAVDWGMSLEPKWFSTIYGAMLITGEALATLAFMIVTATLLAADRPMKDLVTSTRLHDLGNLLLAFVMLWAYMSFSQFLIVWAGDLAEETPWYIRRTHGGWQWVALLLISFHFFLPFFVLLFRESKRESRLLIRVALLVLTMHLVDLVWLVMPASTETTRPRIPWADLPLVLIALAGIGGVWITTFLWRLKGAALVPFHDAHVRAALERSGGE